MCGLTGMAGNGIISQDLKVLKDMLYVSSLRGIDSTGLMIANTHKPKDSQSYGIVKEAIPSPQFIEKHSKRGGVLSSPGLANLFMGHCRWATVGDTTEKNAHPFETNKLVGMHNGTLIDWEYAWDPHGRTDSEMMFEDMSKQGILPILGNLSDHSAYAITVYDKKSRKLYLARNTERTLSIGFNRDAGVMYWASEFYMMCMAAERNNVKIDGFYLKPGILYEIDIDKIKKGDTAPWVAHPITKTPKKAKLPKYPGTALTDASEAVITSNSGWTQMPDGRWEHSYE